MPRNFDVSKAEIYDMAGFDINDALMRIHEMLADDVSEEMMRATLPHIPNVHWKPLLNRARAVKRTMDSAMPPELRQAWARATLNEIVEKNVEENPLIALKGLTQISKDPELQLTAKTSSIHIDMATAARLDAMSKARVIELKASDGLDKMKERKPDE